MDGRKEPWVDFHAVRCQVGLHAFCVRLSACAHMCVLSARMSCGTTLDFAFNMIGLSSAAGAWDGFFSVSCILTEPSTPCRDTNTTAVLCSMPRRAGTTMVLVFMMVWHRHLLLEREPVPHVFLRHSPTRPLVEITPPISTRQEMPRGMVHGSTLSCCGGSTGCKDEFVPVVPCFGAEATLFAEANIILPRRSPQRAVVVLHRKFSLHHCRVIGSSIFQQRSTAER